MKRLQGTFKLLSIAAHCSYTSSCSHTTMIELISLRTTICGEDWVQDLLTVHCRFAQPASTSPPTPPHAYPLQVCIKFCRLLSLIRSLDWPLPKYMFGCVLVCSCTATECGKSSGTGSGELGIVRRTVLNFRWRAELAIRVLNLRWKSTSWSRGAQAAVEEHKLQWGSCTHLRYASIHNITRL